MYIEQPTDEKPTGKQPTGKASRLFHSLSPALRRLRSARGALGRRPVAFVAGQGAGRLAVVVVALAALAGAGVAVSRTAWSTKRADVSPASPIASARGGVDLPAPGSRHGQDARGGLAEASVPAQRSAGREAAGGAGPAKAGSIGSTAGAKGATSQQAVNGSERLGTPQPAPSSASGVQGGALPSTAPTAVAQPKASPPAQSQPAQSQPAQSQPAQSQPAQSQPWDQPGFSVAVNPYSETLDYTAVFSNGNSNVTAHLALDTSGPGTCQFTGPSTVTTGSDDLAFTTFEMTFTGGDPGTCGPRIVSVSSNASIASFVVPYVTSESVTYQIDATDGSAPVPGVVADVSTQGISEPNAACEMTTPGTLTTDANGHAYVTWDCTFARPPVQTIIPNTTEILFPQTGETDQIQFAEYPLSNNEVPLP